MQLRGILRNETPRLGGTGALHVPGFGAWGGRPAPKQRASSVEVPQWPKETRSLALGASIARRKCWPQLQVELLSTSIAAPSMPRVRNPSLVPHRRIYRGSAVTLALCTMQRLVWMSGLLTRRAKEKELIKPWLQDLARLPSSIRSPSHFQAACRLALSLANSPS